MGIGIGAKNATVPIFSAELSPHRIRGLCTSFSPIYYSLTFETRRPGHVLATLGRRRYGRI
jgi:hypothetical protein